MDRNEYWSQIYAKQDELLELLGSYWQQYSSMGTWEFWLVLSLLLLPLIILFFLVDRSRIFELFFFGFVVHMLWTYIDSGLSKANLFTHTHFLSPYFHQSFSVTASVLPVGFLLLYQYCTNKGKSFYLYVLGLSFIFAFLFLSIEKYLGIVQLNRGMNQFYVFLIDIAIAYAAYWFTRFVLKLKRNTVG